MLTCRKTSEGSESSAGESTALYFGVDIFDVQPSAATLLHLQPPSVLGTPNPTRPACPFWMEKNSLSFQWPLLDEYFSSWKYSVLPKDSAQMLCPTQYSESTLTQHDKLRSTNISRSTCQESMGIRDSLYECGTSSLRCFTHPTR